MKILIVNGANLNLLGIREPDIYGHTGYSALCQDLTEYGRAHGITVETYQSNHEGDLVDRIQAAYGNTDGIVINPGAYTHTSIALLDALKAVGIPAIEVHISDPDLREDFRKVSYIRFACFKTIKGHGVKGYFEAVDELIAHLNP